jgi:hypothetical protein
MLGRINYAFSSSLLNHFWCHNCNLFSGLKLYIIMQWFEFVLSCQFFFIIIVFGDPRKVKYYALSCDFVSQELIIYFINSELLKSL